MKVQIKSRFDASVLFKCEADSFKLAVECAVKSRADLSRANLSGADLYGANLSRANLSGADLYGANLYGEKITKIPIQISGLKWWINITEKHIQIGCEVNTAIEWFKFTDEEISAMHEEALDWWKANKNFIKSAWEHHVKDLK